MCCSHSFWGPLLVRAPVKAALACLPHSVLCMPYPGAALAFFLPALLIFLKPSKFAISGEFCWPLSPSNAALLSEASFPRIPMCLLTQIAPTSVSLPSKASLILFSISGRRVPPCAKCYRVEIADLLSEAIARRLCSVSSAVGMSRHSASATELAGPRCTP